MLMAITRRLSPTIGDCELTYLPREQINVERAIAQQTEYVQYLKNLGVSVITLDSEPDFPDAVFVEDPAVVVDEVAVIPRMGAPSRRSETESMAKVLSNYRPLKYMNGSATLEGGDVVRAGRTLYVGLSTRTNREGIAQLQTFLKTGCSYLGNNAFLINRCWVDSAPLEEFDLIEAPANELWAANVLVIGNNALVPACCPETGAILRDRGLNVTRIDVSELEKAEGSLTCMSVIFNNGKTPAPSSPNNS
jgi:dimethylargininase